MLAVPVHAGAADTDAGIERTQVPHRQCQLARLVAKRLRGARRFLEYLVANGVAQLVLNLIGGEVVLSGAKAATLDGEDFQALLGQLLGQYGGRPTETDQHHVDGIELGHHMISFSGMP